MIMIKTNKLNTQDWNLTPEHGTDLSSAQDAPPSVGQQPLGLLRRLMRALLELSAPSKAHPMNENGSIQSATGDQTGGPFATFCRKMIDPLVVKDAFLRGSPISHERWQKDSPATKMSHNQNPVL